MSLDPGGHALSSLLSLLRANDIDLKLGSSVTNVANGTTIYLLRRLLSSNEYLNIAEKIRRESDVINVLEFILHLLRHGHLSANQDATMDVSQRARRLMFKIISKTPVVPRSFIVTEVSMPDKRNYIGCGGYGNVFKGEFRGTVVALKVLYKNDANNLAFCREALMWGSLKHNFVLPFIGIHEEEDGMAFLVSPYMKNGTLSQWRKNTNPSIAQITERILEVSQGVEYIHSEGVVHGDLRGENVLLDDDFHVQIADFGLTRLLDATNTRSGAKHFNFAAPELFGCFEDPDDPSAEEPKRTPMSDAYAFGCIYYEIHYDSIPFVSKQDIQIMALVTRGNHPPRLDVPPLSDGAWELIRECWVMEPPKRPRMKGIAEQMTAISQCLNGAKKKKKKKKKKQESQCVSLPTSARNDRMLQDASLSLTPRTKSLEEPTSHPDERRVTPSEEEAPALNGQRPGPLDLTHSREPSSPLTLARPLEDLDPAGVSSPNPELNGGAKEGKFKYDGKSLLKRGEKRTDPTTVGPIGPQAHGPTFGHPQAGISSAAFEPLAPLQMSENRWDRKALVVSNDPDAPEVVDRKVKGLLNKLTIEKFDSISDQIIQLANRSENEKDGRTLIQVIRLVFEKATDEATWSEMYARLCRKMMEQISTHVHDEGIKNAEGKPIAGGQLFRKYLLNRCQEDFERGWVAKEAAAAGAAIKAKEDQAIKDANERNASDKPFTLYSAEYYVAQRAKRRGLGVIKFTGELFKFQMLTERIMHECIRKLLGNVDDPEESEIEGLCKLMTTVGLLLDTQRGRAHMDVYFQRMKELTHNLRNVSPRVQFMLQDVLELRERKWVARNAAAGPATLAQIREAEKAAQEKESTQRISMSRGGSRRGGNREDFPQADGWTVNATHAWTRAGDLSQFGRVSKAQQPTTFGPASVVAGKKEVKRKSISGANSMSNMFSIPESATHENKEQPQRKKLMLWPRTMPLEEPTHPDEESITPSEEEAPGLNFEMNEEAANAKIKEDLKELFNIRDLDEAEVYFSTLPSQYHHSLVNQLASSAVESKEPDARLVADLFTRAKSKGLCSPDAFEEGLTPMAEVIEDIVIDAPKAGALFATMVNGAELDEERRTRLVLKLTDKLLGLLVSS